MANSAPIFSSPWSAKSDLVGVCSSTISRRARGPNTPRAAVTPARSWDWAHRASRSRHWRRRAGTPTRARAAPKRARLRGRGNGDKRRRADWRTPMSPRRARRPITARSLSGRDRGPEPEPACRRHERQGRRGLIRRCVPPPAASASRRSTQCAWVDRSRLTPSRAWMSDWRFKGKWPQYLATSA